MWKAPPPTRGWTCDQGLSERRLVGSPAHAGMDPISPSRHAAHSRLPRPRGDGPLKDGGVYREIMAPPPTRGWTLYDYPGCNVSCGSRDHARVGPCSCSV